MRLFVAVDLDEHARRGVAVAIGRLRQQCKQASRDLAYALRWKSPDTLHLTVHFLGEVKLGRLPTLRAVMAQPVRLAPFDIEFGDLGVFPTRGESRVIRLDVASGAGGLGAMYVELWNRLTRLGLELESRRYIPHLTLARLKSPVSVDLGALLATMSIEPVGSCRVDHATLYRSKLSPLGSTYAAVLRIPLEP
ncbi:MAG: RNA 2',3'-cyclic phosphodiesterase [Acidobacteria bacterium]|jgi:2'-5' RNA ligase|nr:RNA 2',3'-cyclic phosphodiesterase [Acidobacteriota bacterium]